MKPKSSYFLSSRMSQGFYELLAALSSEDNGIRSQAEDKYASINGEQKLQVLLPAIADGGLSDTQRLLGKFIVCKSESKKEPRRCAFEANDHSTVG